MRKLLLGVLLCVVPFVWLGLNGRTFIGVDSIDVEYPYLDFLRKTLFLGRPEWWNPHIATGSLIVGSSAGRVFYPLSLFFALADPLNSMLWYWCLHVVIGFCGAFLYLRSHRLSDLACLSGGLAYALSPLQVTTCINVVFYPTFAFAPWLLWCVENHVRRPGPRTCLGLTVLISLIVHGSHQQMGAIFLGNIALYGAWLARRSGRSVWLGVAAAAVLAFLLWTPILSSFRKLHAHGIARSSATFDPRLSGANGVGLQGAAVALFPPFFGPVAEAEAAAGIHLHEHNYGPGIALLPLVCLGVGSRRHRRWIRPWLVFCAVALFFGLGGHNPVYRWLQEVVPLLGSFRAPTRFLAITNIATMILVAVGTERWRLLRGRALPWRGLLWLAVFYGVFCFWGKASWLSSHALLLVSGGVAVALWRGAGGAPAIVTAALLPGAAALLFVGEEFVTSNVPIKQHLSLLRSLPLGQPGARVFYTPQPEITQMVGLDNIATFSPLTSTPYARYLMTALNGRELNEREFGMALYYSFHPLRVFFGTAPQRPDNALYAMLGAAYAVFPDRVEPERPSFGRVWFSRTAQVVASPEAARQRMLQTGFDPRATLLLDKAPSGVAPPYTQGEARLSLLQPSRVIIDLRGSSGWLTMSDLWFEGWRAEVDGQPREILRGYTVFRSLPVYPGEKQVVLRYHADEMERSLPFAVAGLAGLVVLGLLALRRQDD
jgi:hypothetical protein